MTCRGGDGKPWRHVARRVRLIRAGAGFRDREGLFFQTGRAELRVDRGVCGQNAGPRGVGSSPMAFLAVRTVLVDNGVGSGRLDAGVGGAVIIVLVLGRYLRGAGDERR